MILVNKSTGLIIAAQVELARSFTRRLRGLLGKKTFPAGAALVIEPCRQVHTFFMSFPIDVIFLDRRDSVLATLSHLPPGRISPYFRKALRAVELPAGAIAAAGVTAGNTLKIVSPEKHKFSQEFGVVL